MLEVVLDCPPRAVNKEQLLGDGAGERKAEFLLKPAVLSVAVDFEKPHASLTILDEVDRAVAQTELAGEGNACSRGGRIELGCGAAYVLGELALAPVDEMAVQLDRGGEHCSAGFTSTWPNAVVAMSTPAMR